MFGTSTVRRLGFSLALGLVLPSLMAAQGASPASGSATAKIGIVNMEEAIVTCNEGKKELDALQQRFEPKRATLKTLNDEIEGLKQQLQSQGPKLSDDERTTRERTIQTKQTTLQRNFDDAQAEFQRRSKTWETRFSRRCAPSLKNMPPRMASASSWIRRASRIRYCGPSRVS